MRKIVQIAAIPETEDAPQRVFVLCDDGTAWYLQPNAKDLIWRQLPDVPEKETPPV
jgi:hypothetical protein